MSFVKTWWHEITIAAAAIWWAIGTQGQDGLANLVTNIVAKHHWSTIIPLLISFLVARYRTPPDSQPTK